MKLVSLNREGQIDGDTACVSQLSRGTYFYHDLLVYQGLEEGEEQHCRARNVVCFCTGE